MDIGKSLDARHAVTIMEYAENAYLAFYRKRSPKHPPADFDTLSAKIKSSWREAAIATLSMSNQVVRELNQGNNINWRCALPRMVTRDCAPDE